MRKILLDKNWQFLESDLVNKLMVNIIGGWKKVTLPHDYGIEKDRNPSAQTGPNEGYTQAAGLYYRKELNVDKNAENKQFWLEFEAVTGITQVWANGEFAAKHLNSFTGFWVNVTKFIKPGAVNEIRVFTDNRHKPNCRWYTGTGMYGHVWMHVGEAVAVKPNTLHTVTKKLERQYAVVSVQAQMLNEPGRKQDVRIVYTVLDAENKEIAREMEKTVISETGIVVNKELTLDDITPWSPEKPYLYTVRIEILTEQDTSDVTDCKTGIRTITVDTTNGLRLNGKPMKLRGGCIHHDVGILGVAGYDAAIRRKISLLKENGFNALRFSHNPYLPGFYDACDELGMLVVAEAFDEWVLARTSFGSYKEFEYEWEQILESLIGREYNHPCVFMWSTGNEVEERDGSADGYAWSKRLAEKVRSLDTSRPVSVTACSLSEEYGKRPANGATGNQALNMAYDNFESGEDLWGDKTAAFFAPVDVAGYNYKTARYAHDGKKFPTRVIYGSESYSRGAYGSWKTTLENIHVIGDFVWTAMDYLGEQGLGRYAIGEGMFPPPASWPWLTAHAGDLDLIGAKRPQSYYRDILWQRTSTPVLFVLSPELTGKPIMRMSWTWDLVERNYTYPGKEGRKIEAHIYAAADEVELFQNGKSLGRKKPEEYKAVFEIEYEPDTLSVTAIKDGKQTGWDMLKTAGQTARLALSADRNAIQADGSDLCFVNLLALDEKGEKVFCENGEVSVTVQGDGELLAFGNADPKPDRLRPFKETTCPLYHGIALAVVRSKERAKGCVFSAAMKNGISASLVIGFLPVESGPKNVTPDIIISELKSGVLDTPIGELLDNKRTLIVLKEHLPELIENPMINQMRGLSLRKIAGIDGSGFLSSEKMKKLEKALGD
jgi:beta-galactosidase